MTNEELITGLRHIAHTMERNGHSYYQHVAEGALQALNQRWIPVTEAAPPKGTICLWCNKQGNVFTSEITYRSECNSYVGKHGYFSNELENYGNIIAWMPLPEPYKEDAE